MSSEASPALKTACPFCKAKLTDARRPALDTSKGQWYVTTSKFVACPICRSVFRIVPSWFRLTMSGLLLAMAVAFALLLVTFGHIVLGWLDDGHQLTPILLIILSMISGFLIYGGICCSERLFDYLLNRIMVLVSHPDLDI